LCEEQILFIYLIQNTIFKKQVLLSCCKGVAMGEEGHTREGPGRWEFGAGFSKQ
jgi:hypothetical protein